MQFFDKPGIVQFLDKVAVLLVGRQCKSCGVSTVAVILRSGRPAPGRGFDVPAVVQRQGFVGKKKSAEFDVEVIVLCVSATDHGGFCGADSALRGADCGVPMPQIMSFSWR